MKQFDERVDAYIAKSAPFAKEILHHIRKLVHEASPLINETMKWSFPHFVHKQTICSMASFKISLCIWVLESIANARSLPTIWR
jgi:hypothetical protein